MSFGYAVGDVIAVLGLFERVAVELRNYKDAPAHFQQLSAELDLLRGTLQHVLQIRPETEEEQQTLEKVRAIAIHCLQPLRALSARMEAKQSSLGHFRTNGTLRAVGTRLHWSMLAQKDVDELRKTVLSEIVAINMLLSVQQLVYIKQLSAGVQKNNSQLSANFDSQTNALLNQTSIILNLVTGTPDAIANLHALTATQAEEQARQTKSLFGGMKSIMSRIEAQSLEYSAASTAVHGYVRSVRKTADRVFRLMQDIQTLVLFLVTCTKEMLEAIGRNTRLLLDIANHMKRIVKSIEAIPLHLTVGIVRLDDALGESWGLPIQACGNWNSFHDLLKSVVFANGRAGAQKVLDGQFVITLSKTGQQVNPWHWEKIIVEGAHIEQAMIVKGNIPGSDKGQRCLRPGCNGTVVNGVGNRSNSKSCLRCSQLAISQKRAMPVLNFMAVEAWAESSGSGQQTLSGNGRRLERIGPESVPRLQVDNENIHSFQRVCTIEPLERIQDISEARARLEIDETDAAANRCVGLHLLQNREKGLSVDSREDSIRYLRAAAQLGNISDAETWYLLARAYLDNDDLLEAYNALIQAVYWAGRSPSIWITVGIVYFRVRQYQDCLDALARSIRLSHMIWQAWFNFGVLYEVYNRQHDESRRAFRRCLELKADLPEVAARVKVLESSGPNGDVPDDFRLEDMRDCELRTVWDIRGDISNSTDNNNSNSGTDAAVAGNTLDDGIEGLPIDGDVDEWESASESDLSRSEEEERIVFRKAVHFDADIALVIPSES